MTLPRRHSFARRLRPRAVSATHREFAMNPAMSQITVIIPTYGHGLFLAKVMGALMAQQPNVPKTIVVHSGDHPPAPLWVDQPERIQVLHSDERLYAGAARNWGMKAAETPWVTFIDDDMIVADGWHKAV